MEKSKSKTCVSKNNYSLQDHLEPLEAPLGRPRNPMSEALEGLGRSRKPASEVLGAYWSPGCNIVKASVLRLLMSPRIFQTCAQHDAPKVLEKGQKRSQQDPPACAEGSNLRPHKGAVSRPQKMGPRNGPSLHNIIWS